MSAPSVLSTIPCHFTMFSFFTLSFLTLSVFAREAGPTRQFSFAFGGVVGPAHIFGVSPEAAPWPSDLPPVTQPICCLWSSLTVSSQLKCLVAGGSRRRFNPTTVMLDFSPVVAHAGRTGRLAPCAYHESCDTLCTFFAGRRHTRGFITNCNRDVSMLPEITAFVRLEKRAELSTAHHRKQRICTNVIQRQMTSWCTRYMDNR